MLLVRCFVVLLCFCFVDLRFVGFVFFSVFLLLFCCAAVVFVALSCCCFVVFVWCV